MRGLRVFVLLTVVLALGPLAPGTQAQQSTTFGLDPSEGPAGSRVLAIGRGWTQGSVGLYFDSAFLRGATPDDNGNFSVSFSIPPNASPGDHTVTACSPNAEPPCPKSTSRTANFRVTPPPTTTTSSTTTTTEPPESTTTTTRPEESTTSTEPESSTSSSTTSTSTAPTSIAPSTTTSSSSTSTTTTTTAPPGPGAPPAPPRPAPALLAGTAGAGLGTGLYAPSTTVRLDEEGLARLDEPGFRPRCSPPDGAEIIDFDDLPTGTDPSEAIPGIRLSADNLNPLTRARTAEPETLSIFAPSTGTISEGNGVRWRDAGERPEDRRYGDNVVEIRFDEPQRVVGLYVGQTGAGDHGSAALRTGPADAPREGVDSVFVSGGSALVTCMLVFRPDGSAFDTVTLIGNNYNRPEFDRLFFSETPFTPPARAGGASEAEITIFRPTPGQSFDAAAAFTVTGGVFLNAPRGGFAAAATPLDEVRVTWVDWDGMSFVTREVELSRPSPRGIVDGRAAGIGWTFRLDGVKVPPGESRIHAVAVGDRFLAADDVTVTGNGAPDAPPEGYAGKVDFQPLGVEVTQGLRPALRTVDPGGAFTEETVHVARRQTVVRLYGRTEFSGTRGEVRRRTLPAEARLWGFSRRGALPGSPISPRNPVIDVTPVRRSGLALAGQRLEASRSWNFVLPPGWTGASEITLVAEINPPSSPTHIPETKRTGGARNLTTVRRVRFAEIAPRPVNVILAESHQSDGRRTQRFVPTLAELAGVFDYWYRTWPIPVDGLEIESVDVYRQSFQACTAEDPAGTVCDPAPPASAPVWDNGVLAARYPDGMTDDGRRFIPLLFSPGSLVGCSGVAGVGGPPLFHAGACGPTVAQEAGHSMGLIHVSDAHGESTGGAFADRFSGDHGQLEGGAVGWDVRTMQPVPFEDGEEHRHDFMSYGGGSLPWVSTATWNNLARALRESDRGAGLFSGGAQPELVASTKAADDAPGVLVSGRLYGKGKGAIDSLVPAAEGASALPEPPPLSRQARLELRDAGGEVLMERGLEVAPDNHQGGNWPFRAMFPAVPEATAVVLVVGDEEVDSKKSEAPVPVISQVRARHEGDVLKLEFHAGAVDRDPLEVWLQARVGEVWRTVAGPFTGTTTADLPASELGAATGAGLLRMVATDGLHPVPSDVLLADLPPAPLQVAVAGVPAGGRVATHRALTFRALVSGAGGDAPALAWTLDGEPAAGDTEVTLAGVTPGPHVLKLVATTADGRTAEAESRIDVQPDRDGDGLTDGFEGTGDLDPDDPTDADRDGDGDLLAAWEEQAAGSDPGQADTDGDGYSDAVEVAAGSNPSHRASVPVRLHGDPTAEIPRVGAAAGGSGPNGLAALAGITALAAVGGCLALMRRRTNGNPRAGTA